MASNHVECRTLRIIDSFINIFKSTFAPSGHSFLKLFKIQVSTNKLNVLTVKTVSHWDWKLLEPKPDLALISRPTYPNYLGTVVGEYGNSEWKMYVLTTI